MQISIKKTNFVVVFLQFHNYLAGGSIDGNENFFVDLIHFDFNYLYKLCEVKSFLVLKSGVLFKVKSLS